jgi:Lectin C-type domain
MRLLFTIFLFFCFLTTWSQSVTAPPGRTYQVSTTGQDASGFVINGFTSETLLTSIGLVNPPAGTTFSITTTTGLSFATGYNTWSNITRISFTGTQTNVNNALASLKINTGSVTGSVQISVSTTINPVGYYYNATNGHFYRPISTGATYDNAKTLSSQQTFKGQTGYLVTITSSDEQNFIIANVPQNNIWFALTDRIQEGYWRVDAGPENGTLINIGNYNGNPQPGTYQNWCGGEPNDAGGEDYAVTKWGGGGCWNDLPATYSNPYVIEFGTWSNPSDATFTGYYAANTTNTVAITNTLSGTVNIPATLTSRPLLTLYRVVNGSDVLVDYKTVATDGSYTFTLPSQNSTYKLVPSLTIQGITSTDFDLSINEANNISVPNSLTSGLIITGTKQWKAVDVNKNGILDLGDSFLIAAHLTGFRLINEVLWFNPTDYDSITKNNFGSINSVNFFTINVITSNLTQNIKYCILGDVNLSHSSQ